MNGILQLIWFPVKLFTLGSIDLYEIVHTETETETEADAIELCTQLYRSWSRLGSVSVNAP